MYCIVCGRAMIFQNAKKLLFISISYHKYIVLFVFILLNNNSTQQILLFFYKTLVQMVYFVKAKQKVATTHVLHTVVVSGDVL